MTLNEVLGKLGEMDQHSSANKVVEFVCDNQKYFLTDIEKSPSQFKVIVSRKNYHGLKYNNFIDLLKTGNGSSEFVIFNSDKGGDNKAVSAFYQSDEAVEIAGA